MKRWSIFTAVPHFASASSAFAQETVEHFAASPSRGRHFGFKCSQGFGRRQAWWILR